MVALFWLWGRKVRKRDEQETKAVPIRSRYPIPEDRELVRLMPHAALTALILHGGLGPKGLSQHYKLPLNWVNRRLQLRYDRKD